MGIKKPASAGFFIPGSGMGCSRRRLAHLFLEGGALVRGHILPALAELLLLVRRQLLVALVHVADLLLLVRCELLEGLITLLHLRALVGGEVAPAGEARLELGALFGGHLAVAVGGVHQPVLPLRRQTRPLVLLIVEQALLGGRERIPADGRLGHGGDMGDGHRRRSRREGRQHEPGSGQEEGRQGLHRVARLLSLPGAPVPAAGTGVLPWRRASSAATLAGSMRAKVMGSTQRPSAPCQSARNSISSGSGTAAGVGVLGVSASS